MTRIDQPSEIRSSRKRLAELQERRKNSVTEVIRRRRSTIIINMTIEIAAGIVFAVGLFYVMRFISMQKSQMETFHYRIYIGAFTVISCGWFLYIFLKIRSHYRLLKEISSERNR